MVTISATGLVNNDYVRSGAYVIRVPFSRMNEALQTVQPSRWAGDERGGELRVATGFPLAINLQKDGNPGGDLRTAIP